MKIKKKKGKYYLKSQKECRQNLDTNPQLCWNTMSNKVSLSKCRDIGLDKMASASK